MSHWEGIEELNGIPQAKSSVKMGTPVEEVGSQRSEVGKAFGFPSGLFRADLRPLFQRADIPRKAPGYPPAHAINPFHAGPPLQDLPNPIKNLTYIKRLVKHDFVIK